MSCWNIFAVSSSVMVLAVVVRGYAGLQTRCEVFASHSQHDLHDTVVYMTLKLFIQKITNKH